MNRRCHNHDYHAPGFYMVTITTRDRRPLFGACANNRCTLNADGWLAHKLWHAIPNDYPEIEVKVLCIMPDHLHGIVYVTKHMEKPLGTAIRAFKSQVTSALRKKHNNPALAPWNPGYNDKCVWRRGSLAAFRNYVMDNPRRYCLKKANPDLFRKTTNLAHACLPAEKTWNGYGNLFLLDRPEKRAVRVSRKATEKEIAALREDVLQNAAEGVVIVSPFISPGEREIAKAILNTPKGDVILMKHGGFPPLFKPHGRFFDLCLEGRLLILSAVPCAGHVEATAKPSGSVRFVHEPSKLSRETCLAMNAWCEHIATI